jgi:uncharacterized LabA/DUF88 family protein
MAFGDRRGQTALFIDGPNLFATAEAVNLNIDYELLLNHYKKKGLLRAYYYTALPNHDEESKLRPLIDWLDYHGYTVVSKPTKFFYDSNGVKRLKGNMDIEICLDIINLSRYLSDVVLFSGDGDFTPLVRWVQQRGIKVTVVSTCMSTTDNRPSPMVANELRRAADVFVDIGINPEYPSDLRELITRVDTRK